MITQRAVLPQYHTIQPSNRQCRHHAEVLHVIRNRDGAYFRLLCGRLLAPSTRLVSVSCSESLLSLSHRASASFLASTYAARAQTAIFSGASRSNRAVFFATRSMIGAREPSETTAESNRRLR
ncbi:uncharacterized protein Tco025E_06374 [Trypanosoma conorhini]|uniref:Uncharacterized protein n=1 Tax=Trypanosoma conorhini TaxID=83891 RepID=A0A3R7RU34_9TRYP|nr:uncharacterized protein Tco025E_06374 [Trypanosoma conorhini]RNF12986.1 hypothetical protein Tco025E_06374 [Trypanosoma conorhini]